MNTHTLKTIVLIGMHRSGTSVVSGVLYKLGVDMGKNMFGKTKSNPLGHFEDINFLNLNDRILNASGGSWENPPKKHAIMSQKEKFKEDIVNLLNKKKERCWGWKDPRTALTIELYLPFLSNEYFIVCHRNNLEIAKSLQKRNGMSIQKAIDLCTIYKENIDNFFNAYPNMPRFDVKYEEILENPENFVDKLVNFLGLEIDRRQYRDAVHFITPKEKINTIARRVERVQKTLKRLKKFVKEIIRIFSIVW